MSYCLNDIYNNFINDLISIYVSGNGMMERCVSGVVKCWNDGLMYALRSFNVNGIVRQILYEGGRSTIIKQKGFIN
jgi:hypothetical protein